MSPAPVPPPRGRRWLRRLKICLLGCGVLLLAATLWLFLSPDEPPPDVSDIVFEPLKLPDDQNAYAIFAKATALGSEKVKTAVIHDISAYREKYAEMKDGNNWDTALARQWLAGTEAVWPIWEQVARTPRGQIPWNESRRLPMQPPLDELACIRAWDLAYSGQPDAAVLWLVTIFQVGQRIQQSGGDFFFINWGWGFKIRALGALKGITAKFNPSTTVLRQALQQLEANRLDKNSLASALRLNLRSWNEVLDRTANGLSPFNEPEPPKDFLYHFGYAWPPEAVIEGKILRLAARFPLLFKPNQTRRIYIEYLRNQLGAIELGAADLGRLKQAELSTVGRREGIRRFSPENFIGRRLLALWAGSGESELEFHLRGRSITSANEAFLALVLWHREHGALPATLDALVPDYLPAVPRDYFDGQPIRYLRDLRAVWSVGLHKFTPEDLDPYDSVRKEQIYLSLDFAAPPK